MDMAEFSIKFSPSGKRTGENGDKILFFTTAEFF